MTKPEKQDGTMELDVNQIDLLDLPLPPRSTPAIESEAHASKGPPPLPPSLPPLGDAEDPPVPSLAVPALVLPEHHSPRATPAPPVSARKLVAEEPKSSIGRFMLGMGAASLVCVLAYLGYHATHKPKPVAAPPAATSAAPAPTHAFTMAPIEFTAPVSSQVDAPPTTSAHASVAAPATAVPTTSTRPGGTATTHASTTPATSATAKPPRTDELIKVEN